MNNHQLAQGLKEIILTADKVTLAAYTAKTELEICKQRLKNIVPVLASAQDGSEASRERLAKSSPEFLAAIKAYQEAERNYAVTWSAFAALELKLSAYQTLNKLQNQEIKSNTFNT